MNTATVQPHVCRIDRMLHAVHRTRQFSSRCHNHIVVALAFILAVALIVMLEFVFVIALVLVVSHITSSRGVASGSTTRTCRLRCCGSSIRWRTNAFFFVLAVVLVVVLVFVLAAVPADILAVDLVVFLAGVVVFLLPVDLSVFRLSR